MYEFPNVFLVDKKTCQIRKHIFLVPAGYSNKETETKHKHTTPLNKQKTTTIQQIAKFSGSYDY
jgi:hypothetical protein